MTPSRALTFDAGPSRIRVLDVVSEQSSSTSLFAKKKGSTNTVSSKKIQVKLLKNIAGTGQAGDVVQVTPAFFNNRLRPTSLAKLITAEQVEEEQAANAAAELERDRIAQALKDRIESLELCLKRKVGPNGQLFGGVSPKIIMEELHDAIPDDFLTQKNVKIVTVTDESGKKIRGDIKGIGSFKASINLTKDYSATLNLDILAEE